MSYTAALAVLARLAHLVAGAGEDFPGRAPTGPRVTSAGRGGDPGGLLRACDARTCRSRPAAWASSAAGRGAFTAREAALKIREGARMLAEGFDAERFLHGNAVPFTAADGVLLLQPEADQDGLTAAVGEAAARERIPVSMVSLPDDGLSPLLAQLPMTVHLQLMAERFARLRGQDPDTVITGRLGRPRPVADRHAVAPR